MKQGRGVGLVWLATALLVGAPAAAQEPEEPEIPEAAPADPVLVVEPELGVAEASEDEAAHKEGEADHEEGEAHEDDGHFQTYVRFGDPERIEFRFPGDYGLRLVGQSDMEISAVPTDREDPEENQRIFASVASLVARARNSSAWVARASNCRRV